MALCRWSSFDFECDLYVYEAYGGWSINVASQRRIWLEPLPPPVDFNDFNAYYARYQEVKKIPHKHEMIDLPHAGESFSCDTVEDAINTLTMLRDLGYKADYESLFEMIKEGNDD